MQGERSVEESLIKEKPDVMELETEVHIQKLSFYFPYLLLQIPYLIFLVKFLNMTQRKDVDTEGTTENDKAAYTTQEEEKEVKNEGNAGISAGTDRLAEGLNPQEYQDQPENSNAATNTSAKNKDTVELAKMQPVEGNLKKEEQDVLESHEQGVSIHTKNIMFPELSCTNFLS